MFFKSLSQTHASVLEDNVSCAASEASNLPNDSLLLLLHHEMPNKFKV